MKYALAFLLLLQCIVTISFADESQSSRKPIAFTTDVYPMLQRSCIECHGAGKQEGDLRLDLPRHPMDSSVLAPGKPEESEFLRRIRLPRGHTDLMPAVGEPLTQREIAIIRDWIEQGAEWPAGFEKQEHWAYVAPRRPDLPNVSNIDWIRTPIDSFVLERMGQAGLTPSAQANPEKLVRRLFLDLIGLPPTPTEVDAFVADPSTARFERMVDELLQRPQFGERWGRPWLDLARYADSHGFQRDDLRDAWAYRDWVIKAINSDMPFDRFTIEQLAGDLLPNATESQRIATGFHRCTPTNVEAGSLPEETRIEQVLDRVNTTGAVWLGTTLECCQCHDHKYDPFSIRDYYGLLAFYNNTELEADRTDKNAPSSIKFQGPSMPLSDPLRDEERAEYLTQLGNVELEIEQRRQGLNSSLETWIRELAQELSVASQTHLLEVLSFESTGTSDSFKKLSDGSILLVGDDPPDQDVYILRARGELADIRAFRLEALQHESLPGMGPGRGDALRSNFVLNEFTASLAQQAVGGSSTPPTRELKFAASSASFSQKNWDVSGAIDGNPKSGWAISPKFDVAHWANFVLSEPLQLPADCELEFKLTQNFGQARTIGCFRVLAVTGNLAVESAPAEIVATLEQPIQNWSKKQREKVLDYRSERDESSRSLQREAATLKKKIEQVAADTTLVMRELPVRRRTAILERGDYHTPGEEVQAGTPAVLHPMLDGEANRLGLARWLVAPENPLVARVTVNRWWSEIFGRGIVSTVEDFGIKGDAPTHPELLDWLSVEFMENGWSMKKILKTIVMSSTYQQTSDVTPASLNQDADNRWLARGPRLRMDAEMIRDNLLAISGLLDLGQFGAPIRPFQPEGIWTKVGGTAYKYEVSPGGAQYRRGIYVVLKRGSPYPSFSNFDATARLTCTFKRSRTNTPLQALTLLNDPVYVAAAQAFATRIQAKSDHHTIEERIAEAFQRCTARRPNELELETLQSLYTQQLQTHVARGTTNPGEAAWRSVATVLLNLHETITKD